MSHADAPFGIVWNQVTRPKRQRGFGASRTRGMSMDLYGFPTKSESAKVVQTVFLQLGFQ